MNRKRYLLLPEQVKLPLHRDPAFWAVFATALFFLFALGEFAEPADFQHAVVSDCAHNPYSCGWGFAEIKAPPAIQVPDLRLTPGELGPAPLGEVCRPGFAKSQRHTKLSTKRAVLAAYGVRWEDRSSYELDHLVPLCLGGADTAANLWPQSRHPKGGKWTAAEKDRLERCACSLLCRGDASQATLARGFRDWPTAYLGWVPICEVRRRR